MRFLFYTAISFILFPQVQMLPARGRPCASDTAAAAIAADKSAACPSFIDYAGQRYTTVQIGSQCWLRENLNVGIMISSHADQTNNSVIEKYCYGNIENRCGRYGAFYQWAEAMQYSSGSLDSVSVKKEHFQGICPDGWHIPTAKEYYELSEAVGGDAEKLKVLKSGIINAKDENAGGFNALIAGYRDVDGSFRAWGTRTLFWSSTEYSDSKAHDLYLQKKESAIGFYVNRKNYGFHIRCLKD